MHPMLRLRSIVVLSSKVMLSASLAWPASIVTASVLLWRRMVTATLSLMHSILSLYFNSHFPGGPGLARTRISPFWIPLELRMMDMVVTIGAIRHAKHQSSHHHQQTNSQFFYRPDALSIAQPPVSEHTHTHSILTTIFPGEPGLAGCPLNSLSPFIPGLRILLGHT